MGFELGDKVVMIGKIAETMGRPRVREITKIVKRSDGSITYGGDFWFTTAENLVHESKFVWPSELEMRIRDKKAKDQMDKMFDIIKEHE